MTVAQSRVKAPVPRIRLQPSSGWVSLKLRELWSFRELLYFLVWRDYKVRYKQTILGVAWAILQPFLTMVVFSFFFGRLARIDSDGLPYPIFNFAALVPWTFFAYGLNQASNSLVNSANILNKIYFPRLAMPLATVLAGLVDFLLAFLVLIGMMAYYGFAPTVNVVFLPLFVLLTLITSLGIALWLSAMNVLFRDVRYMIPFLTQFWFFVSPIAYSSSMLEEPWRTLYGLNPMAGVIEGFRWSLLGIEPSFGLITLSWIVAPILLISGAYYFRRMEKVFADVV